MRGGGGWRRLFDDPIPLPRGRQLVTRQDAGNYITKLPKAEHDAPEWQAAMEVAVRRELIRETSNSGEAKGSMLSLVPELLLNIAHIGKANEGGLPWRVRRMKKLSRRDWLVMTLFAFVAAGTAIVVLYWLYWTGG